MLLGSGGGRFVRLWRCCLLSVPLGEQASGRRWDCSGLGHVARRCFGIKSQSGTVMFRGHGVPEMKRGAIHDFCETLKRDYIADNLKLDNIWTPLTSARWTNSVYFTYLLIWICWVFSQWIRVIYWSRLDAIHYEQNWEQNWGNIIQLHNCKMITWIYWSWSLVHGTNNQGKPVSSTQDNKLGNIESSQTIKRFVFVKFRL